MHSDDHNVVDVEGFDSGSARRHGGVAIRRSSMRGQRSGGRGDAAVTGRRTPCGRCAWNDLGSGGVRIFRGS